MSQEGSKNVLEDYLESLLRPESNDSDTEIELVSSSADSQVAVQSNISVQKPVSHNHHRHSLSPIESRTPERRSAIDDTTVQETALQDSRKKELQELLSRQILNKPTAVSEPKHTEVVSTEKPRVTPQVTQRVKPPLEAENVVQADLGKQKTYQSSFEKTDELAEIVTLDLKPPLPWLENGRPPWGQEPFHALLFKVSGLTLAVPLVSLGQIHNITDKLTPLFGQADWFMGLQETSNGRIRTINTALYVMPERYNPAFVKSAKYVISIEGLRWGLAVDEVQQPKELDPDDITWRTQRSSRPWLAGTVKTEMCALLDIPQMGYQLEMTQVRPNEVS